MTRYSVASDRLSALKSSLYIAQLRLREHDSETKRMVGRLRNSRATQRQALAIAHGKAKGDLAAALRGEAK